MNENASSKIIVLPPPKESNESKEKYKQENENKKVAKKEVIKRQITTTPKWTFSQDDIFQAHQPNHLYDKAKQPFLYQQIKAKLSSYRAQDNEKQGIEKGFIDQQQMDLSGVIQKLEQCNFKCFYCKEIVLILYDNVRDPRQWTLERLNNKRGHVLDNVEIACLSCNLRRRTMKYERYIMTKEIQKVVKL